MPLNSTIEQAVTTLREGGVVAFPTETVYGLGADAKNASALKKVFDIKKRPANHPLIVHLADMTQLSEWAIDISDAAWTLGKTCWPGPLTLILKKAPHVLDLITGGQDTIGLRIPNHPLAHALITQFGSGLAAPSANRFGRISPTTALAVTEELRDTVNYVIDGGPCLVGVESTILDLSTEEPTLLRPGMITKEHIEQILKKPIAITRKNAPRVSGSLASHYAPETKTRLIKSGDLADFVFIADEIDSSIALLSRTKITLTNKKIHQVLMSEDPNQYAHDLYHTLRLLDKQGFAEIVIEEIPELSEWAAIRDRLSRACFSTE